MEILEINDQIIKIRKPLHVSNPRVTILLHGWTGDENSMWVFSSALPETDLLIAPRAPFPSSHVQRGGYSWVNKKSGEYPWWSDFQPAVEFLEKLLEDLSLMLDGDFSTTRLVGFSQGAALSYAYAILNPHQVNKISGLSGFFPERCEAKLEDQPLIGIPVFMGHGTLDDIVPLEMAYYARNMVDKAGADVSFCETNVGHKLGAECMKAFKEFMK